MGKRMHDHPLAHAGGEIGIDHPDDWLIGQSGIGEEMVHAGAKRHDRPKIGKVLERARGVAPAERIADGGTIERLVERRDLMGRQQYFHPSPPGLWIPSRDGDEYAHEGVPTMRSTTGSPGESGASSRR